MKGLHSVELVTDTGATWTTKQFTNGRNAEEWAVRMLGIEGPYGTVCLVHITDLDTGTVEEWEF